MRRFALMLVFALPLFGYEIRSPKYALTIEVKDQRYIVSVEDLAGKSFVVTEELPKMDDQVSETFVAGDVQLHVRIHERDRRLNAELRVTREEVTLDVLHATWLTEPYAMPPIGTGPYRVGGDVKAPVVISRVPPLYTAEAKAAGISGIVIMEAIIDSNGNVTDVKVLKPLPFGLDQAAADALRQWKFKPGTLDGEPVDVIFNLTISFKPTESPN